MPSPNVSALGRSSDWLADYLLSEAGVAALPGTAFGAGGEGYLRFSFLPIRWRIWGWRWSRWRRRWVS